MEYSVISKNSSNHNSNSINLSLLGSKKSSEVTSALQGAFGDGKNNEIMASVYLEREKNEEIR